MKVLLFGGSFDPPHYGHMNLLENAICAVGPGQVLVVPAGVAPHKAAGASPAALRLAMCRCFQPLFPGLEVSDMETVRQGKSFTVDTLAALAARWPDAELYLCMGGDMLRSFTAWHRWQDILAKATLVAAARQLDEDAALAAAADTLRKQKGCILLAPGPVLPESSTAIRAAVAAGDESAYQRIPPPANAIARQNGLYKV